MKREILDALGRAGIWFVAGCVAGLVFARVLIVWSRNRERDRRFAEMDEQIAREGRERAWPDDLENSWEGSTGPSP